MDAFEHFLSLGSSRALRPEDVEQLRSAYRAMKELDGDAVRADFRWCAAERQWRRSV